MSGHHFKNILSFSGNKQNQNQKPRAGMMTHHDCSLGVITIKDSTSHHPHDTTTMCKVRPHPHPPCEDDFNDYEIHDQINFYNRILSSMTQRDYTIIIWIFFLLFLYV